MGTIINDKGKRFVFSWDDEYRFTISEDKNSVLVENLSDPDSCVLDMQNIPGKNAAEIKTAFQTEDWYDFLRGLFASDLIK